MKLPQYEDVLAASKRIAPFAFKNASSHLTPT